MFPIPWNFPFRKKDGSLSTISAEMGGILPPATADKLGGVKVGSGLTVTSDGTLSNPNELPAYTVETAGKILSVDDAGELEWTENGGGGGITTITDIPFSSFPYTATEKGFVSVFFVGSSSTGTSYYDGVALNNVNLLVPNTYNVSFNNKTCSLLIPVNVGDTVSLPGNHEYLANTFNAKFIKS